MFKLKKEDKHSVQKIIRTSKSAREISRAHTLNLRAKGYTVIETADVLEITPRTVINITNNYKLEGLQKALKDNPRPGRPPKFDDRTKSNIVALVCSDPPEGFDRWSLELIKEHANKKNFTKNISRETIRLILQEHDLKPWREKMWCIPTLTGEYTQRG